MLTHMMCHLTRQSWEFCQVPYRSRAAVNECFGTQDKGKQAQTSRLLLMPEEIDLVLQSHKQFLLHAFGCTQTDLAFSYDHYTGIIIPGTCLVKVALITTITA